MESETLPKLPVIDLSNAKLKAASSWKLAVDQVRRALEDYGCFVAVHDQIPVETHDQVLESLEELFDVSEETKVGTADKEVGIVYYKPFPEFPLTEAFSFRDGATLEGTQKFTNSIWPAGNDTFCERTLALTEELAGLVETVQKMILEGYGAESYTNGADSGHIYQVALAKQEEKVPVSETQKRGLSHSDKSFLTVFYQNDVKDLEIETKDGRWIAFDPAPSRVLFMAGDALMGWSNGRIHSPIHVHGLTERAKEVNYLVSVSSFMLGMVQPAKELVDDQHPLLFKPFNGLEFLHFWESNPKATLADYCGVDN